MWEGGREGPLDGETDGGAKDGRAERRRDRGSHTQTVRGAPTACFGPRPRPKPAPFSARPASNALRTQGPYAKRIFVTELGAPASACLNSKPSPTFGPAHDGHARHADPNLTQATELVALMGLDKNANSVRHRRRYGHAATPPPAPARPLFWAAHARRRRRRARALVPLASSLLTRLCRLACKHTSTQIHISLVLFDSFTPCRRPTQPASARALCRSPPRRSRRPSAPPPTAMRTATVIIPSPHSNAHALPIRRCMHSRVCKHSTPCCETPRPTFPQRPQHIVIAR